MFSGGKPIRPMLMFCSWQLWGNLNCPCGVRLTAASEQVPVAAHFEFLVRSLSLGEEWNGNSKS